MVNGSWLGSMLLEIFLQVKFFIFLECPTKQTAFLPWQSSLYNQLLIHSRLLVPEYFFA